MLSSSIKLGLLSVSVGQGPCKRAPSAGIGKLANLIKTHHRYTSSEGIINIFTPELVAWAKTVRRPDQRGVGLEIKIKTIHGLDTVFVNTQNNY